MELQGGKELKRRVKKRITQMKKRGESYLPFVAVSVPIGLTILLQGLSEIIKRTHNTVCSLGGLQYMLDTVMLMMERRQTAVTLSRAGCIRKS